MVRFVLLSLLALSGFAYAQAPGKTIEGFWQDAARRILFSRDAPPAFVYGRWSELDQSQTYPSAKQIRRSGASYELVDLLYDEQETIRVVHARNDVIEFIRTTNWSGCAMHHKCELQGEQLLCSLENLCPVEGRTVLNWRGEERYVRRASCERTDKRQAQGIPHVCR
jgi:hypothetical protein